MPYSNVTPPALPDFSPVTKYSYNGVELPALPEWDKETYPYAYIMYKTEAGSGDNFLGYRLMLTNKPLRYDTSTGKLYNASGSSVSYYGVDYSDGVWGTPCGPYGLPSKYSLAAVNTPVFASYDVLKSSDASVVILAASEPVPIQSFPYYVLVFDYTKGAEDWYQVHLYYSGTPYTYDGTHVTNAEGIVRKDVYDGSAWSGEITSESAPTLTPGFNGDVYQRIYTNHDILDSEGNVWLAADSVTPVEEETGSGFDLKSFLTGLALGLSGKPLPLATKEPTAYSYNGVVLPALPEWDRETYPYAVIVWYDTTDTYLFRAAADPMVCYETDVNKVTQWCFEGYEKYAPNGVWLYSVYTKGIMSSYIEDSRWKECNLVAEYKSETIHKPIWANHDILNEDGTVYLAASDPIPVYE